MRKNSAILPLLILALMGCGTPHQQQVADAIATFKDRDAIEFLHITPFAAPPQKEKTNSADATAISAEKEYLASREVLGKAILEPDRKQHWLTNLQSMVSAGDPRYMMLCFDPAYALRDSGSQEEFILICFKCNAIRFHSVASSKTAAIDTSAAPELEKELADFAKSLEPATPN